MFTHGMSFQWAGAIKIQRSGHHRYIINVTTIQLKLALLALNKTHLFTHYTLFVCSWNVQKSTIYWTGLLIYKALLTFCCVSDFGKQLITWYYGIRIYFFLSAVLLELENKMWTMSNLFLMGIINRINREQVIVDLIKR